MPTVAPTAFNSFLTAVALPLLATLAMTVMRSLRGNLAEVLPRIPMDLGWDLCVLGLGLVGAVASNATLRAADVSRLTFTVAGLTLWNIILGGIVLHVRDASTWAPRTVRAVCITVGCLAVGLPSALLFL
jgi:hypothetical protein